MIGGLQFWSLATVTGELLFLEPGYCDRCIAVCGAWLL